MPTTAMFACREASGLVGEMTNTARLSLRGAHATATSASGLRLPQQCESAWRFKSRPRTSSSANSTRRMLTSDGTICQNTLGEKAVQQKLAETAQAVRSDGYTAVHLMQRKRTCSRRKRRTPRRAPKVKARKK